jgi:hypothetical protein
MNIRKYLNFIATPAAIISYLNNQRQEKCFYEKTEMPADKI